MAAVAARDIGAVPPAAAERLEQGGGVGEAVGLGLHERDARGLLGLLGIEQRDEADGAELQLALGDGEALRRGVLGGDGGFQGIGVGLQRAQRIGDVLEGGDDGAAILRRRLVEGGARRALAVQQGAAVEDRLRQAAGDAPEVGARREQPVELRRRRPPLPPSA